MAFTIHGLRAKVKPYIGNLEDERADYALRESARETARQTMLWKKVISGVPAIAIEVPVDPGEGFEVYRVERVEALDSGGNWVALPLVNDVAMFHDNPTESSIPTMIEKCAYIGDGKLKVYVVPKAMDVDYVKVGKPYKIVTVGTTDFMAVGASANTVGTVFTATGTPTGTGTVAQTLRVTASIFPTADFDEIGMPWEAESCIVSGALSSLLRMPGIHQDRNLAKDFELKHNRELSGLKNTAVYGHSGKIRMTGPSFFAR